MNGYRTGYYDGWLAALAMLDKLSTQYIANMEREGTYLMEDGTLHGDSVGLAYAYAEEACERYAYHDLQDWIQGECDIIPEKPPLFPERIIDAERSTSLMLCSHEAPGYSQELVVAFNRTDACSGCSQAPQEEQNSDIYSYDIRKNGENK